jgi:hypothetical protein
VRANRRHGLARRPGPADSGFQTAENPAR